MMAQMAKAKMSSSMLTITILFLVIDTLGCQDYPGTANLLTGAGKAA
jgi:hypothetical protein